MTKKPSEKHLTDIELFVKNNLTYISHIGGYIEYLYEGDNYTAEFSTNPLDAIRSAIVQINKWSLPK